MPGSGYLGTPAVLQDTRVRAQAVHLLRKNPGHLRERGRFQETPKVRLTRLRLLIRLGPGSLDAPVA
eukprot:13295093-Alexandrium_andersonii.AAC.1